MDVIFDELHRFTESLVAKLMALDNGEAEAPVRKVAAKKAAKVTNGVRGRPRAELSRAEAASYLSVSEATIANLSARGELPAGHTKEGSRMKLFYYQGDLEAYRRGKGAA
jgi:hypothetical protein